MMKISGRSYLCACILLSLSCASSVRSYHKAIALGIPEKHVFSETKAEHSTENLVYSCRMAKKMGFEKIAVATDPFQSNTLKFYAWEYGIPVVFIPIVYDSLRCFSFDSSFKIDPSAAYVSDFAPLPQ